MNTQARIIKHMNKRKAVIFKKPDDVDVNTALEMIKVGIIPTSEVAPVGTMFKISGIPVRALGERTREQFMTRVAAVGMSTTDFNSCPITYKFEGIEAV